jgi:hypothetical protein
VLSFAPIAAYSLNGFIFSFKIKFLTAAIGVRTQTSVKPMSKTPRTHTESGYTSVFDDAGANLPGRSETLFHVSSVNATSLGTAHLVTEHSSSPWPHPEVVALIGLIRLIYLLFLFIILYLILK